MPQIRICKLKFQLRLTRFSNLLRTTPGLMEGNAKQNSCLPTWGSLSRASREYCVNQRQTGCVNPDRRHETMTAVRYWPSQFLWPVGDRKLSDLHYSYSAVLKVCLPCCLCSDLLEDSFTLLMICCCRSNPDSVFSVFSSGNFLITQINNCLNRATMTKLTN